MTTNELTKTIRSGAIEVHPRLRPGLPESAYHVGLANELRRRGLCVVE